MDNTLILINTLTSLQDALYHADKLTEINKAYLISPNIVPQAKRLIGNIEKSVTHVVNMGDSDYQKAVTEILDVDIALSQQLRGLDINQKRELIDKLKTKN